MSAPVAIPRWCIGRPTYKEFVIPFTTFIKSDGVPDFKITDLQHWFECAMGDLCAICGKYLTWDVWYCGSAAQCDAGQFVDLAMHRECMEYAVSVCPFFLGRDYANWEPEYTEGMYVIALAKREFTNRPPELYASRRVRGQHQILELGHVTLVQVGKEKERKRVGV